MTTNLFISNVAPQCGGGSMLFEPSGGEKT
jgi:hypothetical protein